MDFTLGLNWLKICCLSLTLVLVQCNDRFGVLTISLACCAAMIQQPRLPSTGQMPAIDVHIRAKEVLSFSCLPSTALRMFFSAVVHPYSFSKSSILLPSFICDDRFCSFFMVEDLKVSCALPLQVVHNRNTLVELLAKHTGNVTHSPFCVE